MNKDITDIKDIPIILSYDNISNIPKTKKKLYMLKKLPKKNPDIVDISALSLIYKALYNV